MASVIEWDSSYVNTTPGKYKITCLVSVSVIKTKSVAVEWYHTLHTFTDAHSVFHTIHSIFLMSEFQGNYSNESNVSLKFVIAFAFVIFDYHNFFCSFHFYFWMIAWWSWNDDNIIESKYSFDCR